MFHSDPTFERALGGLRDQLGDAGVVELLRPYVSEGRQARLEEAITHRVDSIQIAMERPFDPHNVSAVLRSCEALGGGGVHMIGGDTRAFRSRKSSAGAHYWVPTTQHAELGELVAWSARRGALLVGTCPRAECTHVELPVDRPLCLLLGNEHAGLSDEARAACDALVRIPLPGLTESLNLSVCAALLLAELLRRRRELLGAGGDLDAEQKQALRARFYARSIKQRLLDGLHDRCTLEAQHA